MDKKGIVALQIESDNLSVKVDLTLSRLNEMLISLTFYDLKDEFIKYYDQIQFHVMPKDTLLHLLNEKFLPLEESLKNRFMEIVEINKTNYFIFYLVNCLAEVELQPLFLDDMEKSIHHIYKHLAYYFKKLQSFDVTDEIKH
jgi:hypothetical protein